MPWSELGTILGGLIAGGVGWFASRDAIRRRQEIEEENWIGQLHHLTRRLDFEYGDAADAAESQHQQRYDMKTAELVVPELERHLGSAPITIPDDVRDSQQALVENFTKLSWAKPGKSATVNRLMEIRVYSRPKCGIDTGRTGGN